MLDENIKNPFGLRDGQIIHISEINHKERGLKCNCVCPNCKKPLVAKMGSEKLHHFAHYDESCSYAYQTALHLFAKEVLEKEKYIKIPKVKSKYIDNKNISKNTTITFDKVFLETKLGLIIPDVVIEYNGVQLIIEIAVTHFSEIEKKEKIIEQNISAIEVDLGSTVKDYNNFDREKVQKLLLDETSNKKWLYNKKNEEERKKYIKVQLENEKKKIEKEKKGRRKVKKIKKIN